LEAHECRFRLTFLASRVRGQLHASRLIRRVPAIVGVAVIVFAIPSSDVNSWEWVALVAGCIAIVGLFVPGTHMSKLSNEIEQSRKAQRASLYTARPGATPPIGAK
jgi:hypothetical protein